MTGNIGTDRIEEIDALRGFALMGLFIVHMVEYFELYWYNPSPGWVHSIVFGLFGGKAYGVFALLFGFGFFIIMERNRLRGVDFRLVFAWRMALLWAFGYIHSLIYAGDVLQVLALAGLLLLVLQHLPNRWVFLVSVIFLLQTPAFAYLYWSTLPTQSAASGPAFIGLMAQNFEVFANGSFTELLAHNATQGQVGKWVFTLESGRMWNIVGLVLWGYLLAKVDAVRWMRTHPDLCRRIALGLMVLGGVFYTLKAGVQLNLDSGLANWIAGEVRTVWFNLAVTLLMALVFVLLYQQTFARHVLQWLAPCGRMSLTLYMLQAFVFVPCFYGFGLGWYESIGQTLSLVLALMFWPMIVVAAHLWMAHFHYGPFEWLWRAATYRSLAIAVRRHA